MQMVSIVTFTHQQEKFNENFITLCERVKETGYIVDPMIFCDQKITVKDPYRCFELKGSTKYIRILFSIRNSKSNLLIFVDNDITQIMSLLSYLLTNVLNQNVQSAGEKLTV